MAVYAYLCVPTDRQDVQNQRHGILEYAMHNSRLVQRRLAQCSIRLAPFPWVSTEWLLKNGRF